MNERGDKGIGVYSSTQSEIFCQILTKIYGEVAPELTDGNSGLAVGRPVSDRNCKSKSTAKNFVCG